MDVVLPYAFGALAYYFTQSKSQKKNVMKGGNANDMVRLARLGRLYKVLRLIKLIRLLKLGKS